MVYSRCCVAFFVADACPFAARFCAGDLGATISHGEISVSPGAAGRAWELSQSCDTLRWRSRLAERSPCLVNPRFGSAVNTTSRGPLESKPKMTAAFAMSCLANPEKQLNRLARRAVHSPFRAERGGELG